MDSKLRERIKRLLKKHGLKGVNKPKRTPNHPTKKGMVLAKEGNKIRIIRFGDQKMGHNYSAAARKSFKARHGKNIKKGKMSAAYWANKLFWAGPSGSKKKPPKSQKVKKYEEGGAVPPPGKELTYQELLEYVAMKKGGTTEQLEDMMNRIIYHESGGDPKKKQVGGGPGSGAFQFESQQGGGGIIAVNRAYNITEGKQTSFPELAEYDTPSWIKEAYPQKSFDASKVDMEQQKYLFLMNQLAHPKADLGKYLQGDMSLFDYWAKYHWAGKESDIEARKKNWDARMDVYDKKLTKQN